MKSGYTKAYRKELESDIWQMPYLYHRVFYWIRQKAKWKPELFPTRRKMGIWIAPGQLITSMDLIASGVAIKDYGVLKAPNKKTIKVILEWLEGNGMIQVVSNAYGTTININKWHTYQSEEIVKVTDESARKKLSADLLADADVDMDLDTLKELIKEVLRSNKKTTKTGDKFQKPSLEEITAYCLERKNDVDPETWLDHYTSNGWMVGKNKMKVWKAAVRTWEKSKINNNANGLDPANRFAGLDKAGEIIKQRIKEEEDEKNRLGQV